MKKQGKLFNTTSSSFLVRLCGKRPSAIAQNRNETRPRGCRAFGRQKHAPLLGYNKSDNGHGG